ncbi:MAG: hypothetical protein IT369_21750 [Candidatus Latescibacteria bacterium]|nr:hypothetical protein [Candidatus Latescibacterota bacterium]
MQTLLWGIFLFALAGLEPAAAQPGPVRQFTGLATLNLNLADREGLELNKMRRGDSPFSNLALTLFGDVIFAPRLALFNQLLIDPSSRSTASLSTYLNTYLRYTVFRGSEADLHLQAGKLPTPFGAWGPRAYQDKNPLVGLPLMYHYFTSLRANQVPANHADLLAHRGQGQNSSFTGFKGGGASQPFNGLPMIYDPCWDFGAEAIGSLWRFEYLVALTQGTLSDPRSSPGDNNKGRQLAARLGLVPATGLVLGASYARGPYLDRSVAPALEAGEQVEDYYQQLIGADAEYSLRRFKVMGEVARIWWEVPNITEELQTSGFYLEGNYTLRCRLRAALRYSGLRFSKIGDGAGSQVPWDYDVDRWEAGLSYPLYEGVLGKLAWQHTRLDQPGAEGRRVLTLQINSSF